jgi:hypothetical protein
MAEQLRLVPAAPDPGTAEAKKAGCKCPFGVNHQSGVRGAWAVHPDSGHKHAEWVVSTACKLHWGQP